MQTLSFDYVYFAASHLSYQSYVCLCNIQIFKVMYVKTFPVSYLVRTLHSHGLMVDAWSIVTILAKHMYGYGYQYQYVKCMSLRKNLKKVEYCQSMSLKNNFIIFSNKKYVTNAKNKLIAQLITNTSCNSQFNKKLGTNQRLMSLS